MLAVALATSLIAVPAADAAFPGRNGRIALERFEAGNPRGTALLSVLPGGKDPVRVGDGAFPSWSASARWLAFATGDVMIAKANGAGRRVVAAGGYDPAWAPSGACSPGA